VRAGIALAVGLGVVGAARPGGPAPPCEVRRHLEPPRAFVGQQVRHRVVILWREDLDGLAWETAPRFPGFRHERLSPGHTAPGFVRDGRAWLRREEWVALFPARAGAWTLPSARLRCGAAGTTALPPARFEARSPPDAGRPAAWDGLVGPVSLSVTAEPARVRLGGSVRLTLVLQGAGNLWDAQPVLEAPEGVEVFGRPPFLDLRRGDTLGLVRRQHVDWVPRRAGRLRAPPARVAYLEPDGGHYATAEAAVPEIVVEPAAETVRVAPGAPAGAGSRAPGAPAGTARPWLIAVAGLALLAAAIGLAIRARRGRAPDPVAAAHAEAQHARRRGEPHREAAALERGLRAALQARRGDAADADRTATHTALESSPDPILRDAARALRDLERARFAGDRGSPDLATAHDALNRARRGGRVKSASGRSDTTRDRPPVDAE